MTHGSVSFGVLPSGDAGLERSDVHEFGKTVKVKTGDLRAKVDKFIREFVREHLLKFDAEKSVSTALAKRIDLATQQIAATLEAEVRAAMLSEIRKRAAEYVAQMPLDVSIASPRPQDREGA